VVAENITKCVLCYRTVLDMAQTDLVDIMFDVRVC